MADSSKILTVSYGTFSCTLEGFDDPFSAMRSIAEYFRDLAADDRYFGAEPPTPDADALHRIAERSAQRRVESRVETDGMTLRQVEQAPKADAANEGESAEPAPGPDPVVDEHSEAAEASAPADGAVGPGEDSVAAKLSRIRAVASGGQAATRPDARFVGSIDAAFATDPGIEDAEFEEVVEDAPAIAEVESIAVHRAAGSETSTAEAEPEGPEAEAGADTPDNIFREDFETADAEVAAGTSTVDLLDIEDHPDDESTPATQEAAGIRHAGFGDTDRTEDAAFDRILRQTNTRMDDTEGSRRRSAIAHLKAAVAATKADRLLKRIRPEDEDAEEQSRYRDDLAQVVQPRRPLSKPRDQSEWAVKEGEAAAPLVLVSAQKVVAENAEADQTASDAATDPDGGFIDFAHRMGAKDLPDLLEAAAAYIAFVEGNRLFSRPQLMRRVAQVGGEDTFTREAGLRSFGQLLRQGRIEKLRRGQFTISEGTRFHPGTRMVGE